MRSPRVALVALLVGILPTLGLLWLRPATASPPSTSPPTTFARYALTVTGAGLTGAGTLDAGGGLLLSDPGTATVSARLDEAPSAQARAVAGEPGTTYRTLQSQTGADQLKAPEALAVYPGGPTSAGDSTLGQEQADVTASSATAHATSLAGADASAELGADLAAQTLWASSGVSSGDLVLGPVTVRSVVGTAQVLRSHGSSVPTAGVAPVSLLVAGMPATLDALGVHGPTPVDTVLAQAGITLALLLPTTLVTDRGAVADSGGVSVRVVRADTALGAAAGASTGTDVSLLLGRVVVTESHAPARALVSTVVRPPSRSKITPGDHRRATRVNPAPALPGTAPTTLTTVVGAAAPLGRPDALTPDVAAPALPTTRPDLVLLGHRVSTGAVLAGLGLWQLLTLGTAGAALLAARSRTEEDEHLCPCP
jgi:hypothetical protein